MLVATKIFAANYGTRKVVGATISTKTDASNSRYTGNTQDSNRHGLEAFLLTCHGYFYEKSSEASLRVCVQRRRFESEALPKLPLVFIKVANS